MTPTAYDASIAHARCGHFTGTLRTQPRSELGAVVDLFRPVFVEVSTALSHLVGKLVQFREHLSAVYVINAMPIEVDTPARGSGGFVGGCSCS
jgi:hypothetical protein